jgi:hypothetical protein
MQGIASSTATAWGSGLSSQLTWLGLGHRPLSPSLPFHDKKYQSYKSLQHKFTQESLQPVAIPSGLDGLVGQTFLHVGANNPCLNSHAKLIFEYQAPFLGGKSLTHLPTESSLSKSYDTLPAFPTTNLFPPRQSHYRHDHTGLLLH